jgi:hypothetical protein
MIRSAILAIFLSICACVIGRADPPESVNLRQTVVVQVVAKAKGGRLPGSGQVRIGVIWDDQLGFGTLDFGQ